MPRRRIYDGGNGNGRNHSSSQANPPTDRPSVVRCAIYTRKSTSEGLDQAFNSLDAQREACEAYVASQKALGWQVMPDRYDDGGFTGGNIERPAIQQLLDDVQSGKVDCVVVYKVDRLSRSLLDFARIIKLFEDRKVHFVSVTQHFNTADSMGRLTLNILLSFAQFEREIIAERTRDKIAAARRRGQWSGGRPILGYDLVPGEQRLIVNPAEAEQVRAIFRLYLEQESVLAAAQTLNARGWTTKRWTAANGKVIGGRPFDRANLHHLLTNVAYIGRVRYRDETHPGQHESIIDTATWDKVQRLLRRNARTAGSFLRNKHGALLKGLLRCKACDAAMVQMVSRKGPKLHRYYVCTKAQKRGYDQCPTGTILAGRLEQEVCDQLRRLAEHTNESANGAADVPCSGIPSLPNGDSAGSGFGDEPEQLLRSLTHGWDSLSPLEQARLIRLILESVEYDGRTERVTLSLTDEVAETIAQQENGASASLRAETDHPEPSTGHGKGTAADQRPAKRKTKEASTCRLSLPFRG
jgi:site-specific DNA recombinase